MFDRSCAIFTVTFFASACGLACVLLLLSFTTVVAADAAARLVPNENAGAPSGQTAQTASAGGPDAAETPDITGGVSKNGALHVNGALLVNARGERVHLRGMSTHGIHWFPQFANPRAIRHLKKLGANLLRVAMYADGTNGGYSQDMQSQGLNSYLLSIAVEAALREDVYIIIDWHVLEDRTPLRNLEKAKVFFAETAKRYAGNPAIIYEICNEPNGDTSWDDIVRYAHEVIPIIRRHSPGAVIIVGTPRFSSQVDAAQASPLPYANLMYTYHYYPSAVGDSYIPLLTKMLDKNFPVFVTEWGVDADTQSGELELKKAHQFIRFLNKHKISWANWSLCNKNETFSAIAPHVTKTDGWTEDELTPSGKLVFKALSGF